MAHVADVERSIRFYEKLGLKRINCLKKDDGTTFWAYMKTDAAAIMFSLANGPISSSEQAVLFYLYADNLAGLREQLVAKGISVSPITYPFYMKKGEMRVEDPDGYVLLIGQSD